MKITKIKPTVSVTITLSPFSSINHFKKLAKKHDVEIVDMEELGGWLFKKYRVDIKGSAEDLIRLSQY